MTDHTRAATFAAWYYENHDALKRRCNRQIDEPPYKDEYIFAEAAWDAQTVELNRAKELLRKAGRMAGARMIACTVEPQTEQAIRACKFANAIEDEIAAFLKPVAAERKSE